MDARTQTIEEELAKVFDSEGAATALLERAGVPRDRVPPFGQMTPRRYWESVVRELDRGLTADGLSGLVAAAAEVYPHNSVFREWRQVEVPRTASLPEPSRALVNPTPPRRAERRRSILRLDGSGGTVRLYCYTQIKPSKS